MIWDVVDIGTKDELKLVKPEATVGEPPASDAEEVRLLEVEDSVLGTREKEALGAVVD